MRSRSPTPNHAVVHARGVRGYATGAILLALLAVSPRALSADLAEGLGAYAARDHQRAYRELKLLADRGGAVAQTILGAMYLDGDGVPRDYRQALHWFEAAARQGHTGAQFRLAQLYAAGTGVAHDDDLAQQWLAHAAGRGHPDAQYQLGHRLEPTDRDGAVAWYQRAADRGHTPARRRLAELATATQSTAFPDYPVAGVGPAVEPSGEPAPVAAPMEPRPAAEASNSADSSGRPDAVAYAVQLGAFRRQSSARREQASVLAAHESLFGEH